MLELRPLCEEDLRDLEGTSYADMSREEKLAMLRESEEKSHSGSYFEIFAVCDGDELVGLLNLYAHSKHLISISPEIRTSLRRKGYGYAAEELALCFAADRGYTAAVASVREDNAASIALHEKLGFETGVCAMTVRGVPIRVMIKTLRPLREEKE